MRIAAMLIVASTVWAQSEEPRPFSSKYANGQIKEEGRFLGGKRHGIWRGYYLTGDKRFEQRWERGVRTGRWMQWYQQGHVEEVAEYKDGVRDGVWEQYYNNNQLRQRWIYEKGKPRAGTMTIYHANGFKETTHTFDAKGGRADGVQTAWYNEGSRWYEGAWKNGKQTGAWTWWHSNGQKLRVVQYRNGIRHGLEEGWDLGGRPTEKRYWDGGVPQ